MTKHNQAGQFLVSQPSHHPVGVTNQMTKQTKDQGPEPRLTPALRSSAANHEYTREDGQIEWFTVPEAAKHCRRSESTIRNLVSKYQLRRKTAWTVRNRLRQRRILLAPNVVFWLQPVTLFRQPPDCPPR